MFLPEKESFPRSLKTTYFASAAAPFTMRLYRSREVSSKCSDRIEHIFQSPVSKGVQAQCCHGHLQTQGAPTRICRFCKVSRVFPSSTYRVQTRLPEQMTAPLWSAFSTAAGISAGCEYLVQSFHQSHMNFETE